MIYFSSDWHIGHNKPFIYEARGFSSIEEHNTEILKRCNELVKYDDELWILGDLALGQDEKEWNRVFYSLNCKNIHFIQGNHDTDNKMDKYELEYKFIYEGLAQIIKYSKKYRFYLSHYPTLVGNFDDTKHHLLFNLSGHTHSKDKVYSCGNIYNVALDAHNCYPVSIETIINDIQHIKGVENYGAQ